MELEDDFLEQLDSHLSSANQSWLFGAGISKSANIPLMGALTKLVFAKADDSPHKELLESIKSELPGNCHIEHILSQLSDYCSLSMRSNAGSVLVNGNSIVTKSLVDAHVDILYWIAEIIRWGTEQDANGNLKTGTFNDSKVRLECHTAFVKALFGTVQAGLQGRRKAVRLFTINYDTLLEDALALYCVPYWDGFSGGAVAFRTHGFGQKEPVDGYRAHIVKLHGSIDWHMCDQGKIWRVRDKDLYPERLARVLIHPQSTKYFATQRDPFAAQFDLFRQSLNTASDNVLAICGYSFGDDHINQEIELAMDRPNSKTTLVIFCYEGDSLPTCVSKWREKLWNKRVFIVTEKGLYVGSEPRVYEVDEGQSLTWWTFGGVTDLLTNGANRGWNDFI